MALITTSEIIKTTPIIFGQPSSSTIKNAVASSALDNLIRWLFCNSFASLHLAFLKKLLKLLTFFEYSNSGGLDSTKCVRLYKSDTFRKLRSLATSVGSWFSHVLIYILLSWTILNLPLI